MNRDTTKETYVSRPLTIPADGVQLEGMLVIPPRANGVVVFAHGSGSGRHSPRHNFVAQKLHEAGIGKLMKNSKLKSIWRSSTAIA